jgi:ribosomal protein L29
MTKKQAEQLGKITQENLGKKSAELRKELFFLRLQGTTRDPKLLNRIWVLRKELARALTLSRQLQTKQGV